MRAAILTSPGAPLTVEDVDIDAPRKHEVLVEVRASGLCHSDLLASQHFPQAGLPLILGHEVAGVVAAIGPEVRDVAVGDHVVACEVSSCGRCEDCRIGRPYRCTNPGAAERTGSQPRLGTNERPVSAFSHIGGFAQFILVDENNLATVPDELPFDRAAILGCAVATGAGAAINSAGVRVGDTVAVIGCGGVGLSVLQGAALAGARRVIAVDIQPGKLELARRFGATDIVDAREGDPVERVVELTRGVGVDYAFEAAGVKSTALQAVAMTRPTGTTFLIGIQRPGTVLEFDAFHDLLMGKRSIHSIYMGSTNVKRDIPLYAELYLQRRFNLDDLVARHISLDEIDEGFDALRTGEVARTVITRFT